MCRGWGGLTLLACDSGREVFVFTSTFSSSSIAVVLHVGGHTITFTGVWVQTWQPIGFLLGGAVREQAPPPSLPLDGRRRQHLQAANSQPSSLLMLTFMLG